MDWANKSVVFVDDEERMLSALRRELLDEPYEVRLHCDPERALQDIQDDRPDVVVADYVMPIMVGADLLRHVRELDDSIARVLLTGSPNLRGFMRAVNEGHIYSLLLKPWRQAELRQALRKAIEFSHLSRARDGLLQIVARQRIELLALAPSESPSP